jgi:signal peptidase I
VRRRTKIALGLVATAAMLSFVAQFFVRPSVVFGDSMSPTLEQWDICLLQRVRHYEPRRDEIVMFRTSDDPPLYFIKRVVALPGESVTIERGVITINGTALGAPRLAPGWELEQTVLSADKILVAADNPEFGYGVVATRLVQARLLWHWRWKR